MRQKTLCLVVTFHTTSDAMAMEKACKNEGIAGKLISAPRSVSADCGIAFKSDVDLRESLMSLIEEKRIEIAGIHELML